MDALTQENRDMLNKIHMRLQKKFDTATELLYEVSDLYDYLRDGVRCLLCDAEGQDEGAVKHFPGCLVHRVNAFLDELDEDETL